MADATASRLVQRWRELHHPGHAGRWHRVPLFTHADNDTCTHEVTAAARPPWLSSSPPSRRFRSPLILLTDTRPLQIDTYWTLGASAAVDYALRHGYDLVYARHCGVGPSVMEDKRTNISDYMHALEQPRVHRRGSVWHRFVVVRAALAAGYANVLLLDTDTIVYFPSVGLDALRRMRAYLGEKAAVQPSDPNVGVIGVSNYPWSPSLPCAGNTLWRDNEAAHTVLRAVWLDERSERRGAHLFRARTEAEMAAFWEVIKTNLTIQRMVAIAPGPQFYCTPHGIRTRLCRVPGCTPRDNVTERFFCHVSRFDTNPSVRLHYMRASQAAARSQNASTFRYAEGGTVPPGFVADPSLVPPCAHAACAADSRHPDRGRWTTLSIVTSEVEEAARLFFEEQDLG